MASVDFDDDSSSDWESMWGPPPAAPDEARAKRARASADSNRNVVLKLRNRQVRGVNLKALVRVPLNVRVGGEVSAEGCFFKI